MARNQAIRFDGALAYERSRQGLSQNRLASLTRQVAANRDDLKPVSETTIALLEIGRRQPSAATLEVLALALDRPVGSIGRILGDGEIQCPCCDGDGWLPAAEVRKAS